MQCHQLIEEQHSEAPLLFVRLRRSRRNHGWNVRLGPRTDGKTTASLRRPAQRLRGRLWLVDLGVVGPQRGARPARLRDQVLEKEHVVAQVRRVPQLVRERLIAGDEVDVFVLVLDRLAERVEVAVARDDEPVGDVLALLVEELQRSRYQDRVGPTFEDPAAHALRHGDGFHSRELERHEECVVLGRDLLTEDRELHADGSELSGFLQDRLQDRKRRRQRARRVLAKGVVDVLPVD